MASDSFRLNLPDRPPTSLQVAEFSIRRSSDCSAAARRAKVLGCLTELRHKERNAFSRCVGELTKASLSQFGGATLRFRISEHEGKRCVEARIKEHPNSGSDNTNVGELNLAALIDDEYANKLRAAGALFTGTPHESGNEIRLGWALPKGFPTPTASELEHWQALLRSSSMEEAIATAQRANRQMQLELGRNRSGNGRHIGRDGENLAMLSLVVEKTTNAISIMSPDGVIEWVNDAFTKMTGYSEAEAVGSRLDELLFGPSTAARSIREFHQALRNGHELSQDVLQYNRDGRTFWAECNLRPVLDDNGELKRWIAIDGDITERRRTEEALRASKKWAEATSRAKSEFLANMSHEIRTPLNAILGMTELALTTRLSPEQNDYLRTVQSSAETLLNLLNDILDLSKIEAGKLSIEVIEFNLAEVIRDTLRALAVKAHEKGLELATHIPMDMPQQVVGDPTRIRQVLFNLIGNAIKFTASGEVVVKVEEQWRSDDELGIHVSVQDTGIGIPGDRLRSIFDSFTQVDSSMARKFGGTGLGLTITAQLLAMMKGRIWVRSEEGKGSTFHFSIPLRLSRKPRLGGSRDASMLSGRTALVVDDNATNRKILQDMLGHWGMRTTSSDGAAAALKELENAARKDQPFDIVLLDGMMPVVDGFQLAGMIQQRPDLKCGTIMMLSSADQPQSADKCNQLAITNYLVKPISAASLLDAILVALGDEEAVREKAAADVSREEAIQGGVMQDVASQELRILVVDDHEANRQLARKILERRGHRCTEATDGREAMETLNESTFDLVLMDVQMPNMDGFQATAAIRKSEDKAGHRLPIVALTAHAMSGDRDKCLAAGMDAYLAKPIDARELVAVVERLGGDRPATQRNTASSSEPSGKAAYDFSAALDRVDGEVDLLLDTMNFFLKDAPCLLSQISDAIKKSNGTALQSAAHRLKSLIASFDHDRGVKIAQQLEHMGSQCEFETADESACELMEIVQQLKSAIAAFRDGYADPT